MIQVKCLSHVSIAVDDIEKAEKFYTQIFDLRAVVTFENFTNEAYSKNAGLKETATVSIRQLSFTHCNLVLELICYHTGAGSCAIHKSQVNDMGGLRVCSLGVEDCMPAYELLKKRTDLEILNTPGFFPGPLAEITVDQFKLGADEGQSEEKQRLAESLSKKKFFRFRDPYGVIWEIEDRPFED